MSKACNRCGAPLAAGAGRCSQCGTPRAPAPDTASSWGGLDLKAKAPPPPVPRSASELGTAATMISRPVAPPPGAGNAAVSLPALVAPTPPGPSRGRGFGGDDELVVMSNSAALDMDIGIPQSSTPMAPGAALELDAPAAPKKKRGRTDGGESDKHARFEQVQKLAAFGAVGGSMLEVAQYALRVMLRRRELQAELVKLTAQRDAAQTVAYAAQEALGDAIFSRRSDPALQPVVRELRAVAEAMVALDDTRSAGVDAESKAQAKVDAIAQQMVSLDQQLAPVREREKGLIASINRIDQHKARLQALDKRAQIELRNLAQASNADPARGPALQVEQRERAGELASLDVQLQPFSDELGEVRRELAKHAGTVAALQEDKRAALRAIGELKKQHSATAGSAHKQQQDALRALAQVCIERNLATPEAELAERASNTDAELDRRKDAVALHEAALESFEPGAFKRGRATLVGAVVAVFAVLVVLIAR